MKRAALYLTVILALALCPILAQAQSNLLLKANIPFDFTAGSTQVPSGEYVISSPADHAQLLRSADNKASAIVMSNAIGNPYTADLSRYVLVFHRFGSEYVLTQIWSGGIGHEVRQSKRVSELAKMEKPSETVVAMQVGK